ncbi:unnamed protein product [Amoebophrya sp. A120]|nr:unnamed protein product [Amoebophrya sp. A120]|eukprot:GSA120T00016952001.1
MNNNKINADTKNSVSVEDNFFKLLGLPTSTNDHSLNHLATNKQKKTEQDNSAESKKLKIEVMKKLLTLEPFLNKSKIMQTLISNGNQRQALLHSRYTSEDPLPLLLLEENVECHKQEVSINKTLSSADSTTTTLAQLNMDNKKDGGNVGGTAGAAGGSLFNNAAATGSSSTSNPSQFVGSKPIPVVPVANAFAVLKIELEDHLQLLQKIVKIHQDENLLEKPPAAIKESRFDTTRGPPAKKQKLLSEKADEIVKIVNASQQKRDNKTGGTSGTTGSGTTSTADLSLPFLSRVNSIKVPENKESENDEIDDLLEEAKCVDAYEIVKRAMCEAWVQALKAEQDKNPSVGVLTAFSREKNSLSAFSWEKILLGDNAAPAAQSAGAGGENVNTATGDRQGKPEVEVLSQRRRPRKQAVRLVNTFLLHSASEAKFLAGQYHNIFQQANYVQIICINRVSATVVCPWKTLLALQFYCIQGNPIKYLESVKERSCEKKKLVLTASQLPRIEEVAAENKSKDRKESTGTVEEEDEFISSKKKPPSTAADQAQQQPGSSSALGMIARPHGGPAPPVAGTPMHHIAQPTPMHGQLHPGLVQHPGVAGQPPPPPGAMMMAPPPLVPQYYNPQMTHAHGTMLPVGYHPMHPPPPYGAPVPYGVQPALVATSAMNPYAAPAVGQHPGAAPPPVVMQPPPVPVQQPPPQPFVTIAYGPGQYVPPNNAQLQQAQLQQATTTGGLAAQVDGQVSSSLPEQEAHQHHHAAAQNANSRNLPPRDFFGNFEKCIVDKHARGFLKTRINNFMQKVRTIGKMMDVDASRKKLLAEQDTICQSLANQYLWAEREIQRLPANGDQIKLPLGKILSQNLQKELHFYIHALHECRKWAPRGTVFPPPPPLPLILANHKPVGEHPPGFQNASNIVLVQSGRAPGAPAGEVGGAAPGTTGAAAATAGGGTAAPASSSSSSQHFTPAVLPPPGHAPMRPPPSSSARAWTAPQQPPAVAPEQQLPYPFLPASDPANQIIIDDPAGGGGGAGGAPAGAPPLVLPIPSVAAQVAAPVPAAVNTNATANGAGTTQQVKSLKNQMKAKSGFRGTDNPNNIPLDKSISIEENIAQRDLKNGIIQSKGDEKTVAGAGASTGAAAAQSASQSKQTTTAAASSSGAAAVAAASSSTTTAAPVPQQQLKLSSNMQKQLKENAKSLIFVPKEAQARKKKTVDCHCFEVQLENQRRKFVVLDQDLANMILQVRQPLKAFLSMTMGAAPEQMMSSAVVRQIYARLQHIFLLSYASYDPPEFSTQLCKDLVHETQEKRGIVSTSSTSGGQQELDFLDHWGQVPLLNETEEDRAYYEKKRGEYHLKTEETVDMLYPKIRSCVAENSGLKTADGDMIKSGEQATSSAKQADEKMKDNTNIKDPDEDLHLDLYFPETEDSDAIESKKKQQLKQIRKKRKKLLNKDFFGTNTGNEEPHQQGDTVLYGAPAAGATEGTNREKKDKKEKKKSKKETLVDSIDAVKNNENPYEQQTKAKPSLQLHTAPSLFAHHPGAPTALWHQSLLSDPHRPAVVPHSTSSLDPAAVYNYGTTAGTAPGAGPGSLFRPVSGVLPVPAPNVLAPPASGGGAASSTSKTKWKYTGTDAVQRKAPEIFPSAEELQGITSPHRTEMNPFAF